MSVSHTERDTSPYFDLMGRLTGDCAALLYLTARRRDLCDLSSHLVAVDSLLLMIPPVMGGGHLLWSHSKLGLIPLGTKSRSERSSSQHERGFWIIAALPTSKAKHLKVGLDFLLVIKTRL